MVNITRDISTLLFKYRWIIIPLAPSVFFVSVLLYFFPPTKNDPPPKTFISLSPSPIRSNINVKKTDIPDSHLEPVDQNKLKGFQRKEILADGESKYSSSSTNPQRSNINIAGVNGYSVFQRIITPPDSPLALSKFTNLYGRAKWIFKGSVFYGGVVSSYIYPELGLALIADPQTDQVLEQHIFKPMKVEEYVEKYGDDIPSQP